MALVHSPARSLTAEIGARLVRFEQSAADCFATVVRAIRVARQMQVDFARGRLDRTRLDQLDRDGV